MTPKRNIASTAGGAVVSRYIGMALTFLTFSILSHAFGKAGLGGYASAFGLASTLCYLLGFGAPEGVARIVAEAGREGGGDRRKTLVWLGHRFAALTGLGGVAAVLAVTFFLPANLKWMVAWTGLWVVGWGVNISASHCLIAAGVEKLGSFFFYTASASMNFVIVGAAVFIGWKPDAILAASAVGYILLGLIGTVAVWRETRGQKTRAGPKPTDVVDLIKAGSPFSGARLIQSTALWVPVWAAGLFAGVAGAGVTGAVMRLAVAAAAAMAAIRLVLRRVIAEQLVSGHFRRLAMMASVSGTIFAGLTLIGIVLVWFFGDFGLKILFGKDFGGYRGLLCLALVGTTLESQFGIAEDILKNSGEGLRVMAVQGLAIVAALALVLLARGANLYVYVGGYVLYVAIAEAFYVTWLGRSRGIWIRPMLSPRILKIFLRIRH
jgi:O-antigen/teichoic acid export membrane protein